MAPERREAGRGSVVSTLGHEEPTGDPDAIRRSYRIHRARRAARVEHRRHTRRAGARFWVVLILLVGAVAVLATTTWREIGRLFGL
jgi:hypothetical protein